MAIQTQKTIAEIKSSITALGLQIPSGNPSKSDCIRVLQEYYIKQLPQIDQEIMRMMMDHVDSPMLCDWEKVLTEDEKKRLWLDDDEYRAEEKEDGNRMLIVWYKGHFDAFSRKVSAKTFLPISYKDNILIEGCDFSKVGHDFIIDNEVISSDPAIIHNQVQTVTQLQAVCAILQCDPADSIAIQKKHHLIFESFDIIYFDGVWIVDLPLKERLKTFDMIFPMLQQTGLHVDRPLSAMKDKRAFYESIVARGGEGVVMKNLNSKYNTTGNRQRDGWIKVKRTVQGTLCDTVDAFVTGYEMATEGKAFEGLIGSLLMSAYIKHPDGAVDKTPTIIANVPNFTVDERRKMTVIVDGKPTLNPEYYNRVASVDGQNFSARKMRIQHSIIKCWRPDRDPESCVIEEAFIKNQIM